MRICHIWYGSYPDWNPERDRRNALAQESWKREYENSGVEWIAREVRPEDMPRMSDVLGDEQSMPFVHELIDAGMRGYESNCAVFLTNADVGFAPSGLSARIIDAAKNRRSAHMKRKEIGPGTTTFATDAQIQEAPEYCGMDGTVFTPQWWAENRLLMPPMVWGRYGWDSAMRNLIRWKNGAELSNCLFHRSHESFWNSDVNAIYKNPSNHHNRLLLWEWILTHGGSDADHLFKDGELVYR